MMVLDRECSSFFQQVGVDAKDRRVVAAVMVVVVVGAKQRSTKSGSLDPRMPFAKGACAAFMVRSGPRARQCI